MAEAAKVKREPKPQPTLVQSPTSLPNQTAKQTKSSPVDDEEANVLCSLCSKAFYNRIALRNHVKLQHGVEIPVEEVPNMRPAPRSAKPAAVLPIQRPIKTEPGMVVEIDNDDALLEPRRLVSLASEDISYIIVKTVDAEFDDGPRRRRPTLGTASIAVRKPRSPVRPCGPFECLQRSSFVPGATCHQMFFNCCEYSIHFRREHTKRRKPGLRCQVCEKRLDGQLAGVEGDTTCPACRLECGDAAALAEHTRTAHAKPKPFQCQVCQKGFTQQGGLIQHMRMHTGDRPFPCTICAKAFTQKAGLDQHLRIHTKIKPFRCVVCDKSFSQSVHLRQHMRTHTNIQPFQCGACGRRFKQSSHLNFHLKSHQVYSNDMETALAVQTMMGQAEGDGGEGAEEGEGPAEGEEGLEEEGADMETEYVFEGDNAEETILS